MLDPEIRRAIRAEIRAHMIAVLNCIVGESTTEDQEIFQPVPGAPSIGKRPVAHPYGFASRAPEGTMAVHARIGEHPAARIIIGFRDALRAEMQLEVGESSHHSSTGESVVCRSDRVQLGSPSAANPVVLGDELIAFLGAILDRLVAGDLVLSTSPGSPTAPNPTVVAQIQNLRAQYLTNANTNVVSGHVFTERAKP